MTFIILEGVDGAGKTTLATAVRRNLQERFPGQLVHTIHRSQLERDAIDEYALDIEEYAPNSGHHVIADRWHWGETIYGPLYRDKSALDEGAFRWVELFLKARGATTWHITADLETIQNRLRTRGEDYLASHDVETVWTGFTEVAEKSLLYGGTAYTDQLTVEKIAELIVDEAIWTEDRSCPPFRPEYIGRHLPNVLLVGDVKGNAEPGVTKAPFIARGQSSGKFLFEALPDLWWHGAGVVNANETDINSLHEQLFEPPIVALGMNASEKLNELGLDHAIAPHPQKIRRFHHGEKAAYGRLLRQLSQEGGNRLTWPK